MRFPDLSKAFDVICYRFLCIKLAVHDVIPQVVGFIYNYPSNHSFQKSIGDVVCEEAAVLTNVYQGPVSS